MSETVFDDYLKRLRRELRKLEATADDKPIARRNARRRVLLMMRIMRSAIDAQRPAIKKPRDDIKRRSPGERIKVLKKAGWITVNEVTAGRFASLGVTVKRVAWTISSEQAATSGPTYVRGVGWKQPKPDIRKTECEVLFLPDWAIAIGFDPPRLREAQKSLKIRNAAVVAAALAKP